MAGRTTLICFVFLWECKAREKDFCRGRQQRDSSWGEGTALSPHLFLCLPLCLPRHLSSKKRLWESKWIKVGRTAIPNAEPWGRAGWAGESLPDRELSCLVFLGLQFLPGTPGRRGDWVCSEPECSRCHCPEAAFQNSACLSCSWQTLHVRPQVGSLPPRFEQRECCPDSTASSPWGRQRVGEKMS